MILSIAQHAPAKRRLSLIFSRNFDALGSRRWTRAVRRQVLLRCLTDCNNLTGQTLAVILRSINHVKVSVLFAGLMGRTSLRRRSSEFPNISMVYAWTAWIVLRILRSTEIKTQDYWFHHLWKESYDRKCRISHGDPTWYFSFMGRKEKRGLIAE